MSKGIKRWLMYLLLVFLLSVFTVRFAVQKTDVIGSSMEPTLSDGDGVLVDKVTFRFRDPERFDIIVFEYPKQSDQYYIKRVIGLPGETVQICGGSVYIDGAILKEAGETAVIEDAKRAESPVLLGEDQYFVLGDNRNYSLDSRDADVGNVDREQILGRAFMRIWPLEEIKILEHTQVTEKKQVTEDENTER